jgi:hypothetical protein
VTHRLRACVCACVCVRGLCVVLWICLLPLATLLSHAIAQIVPARGSNNFGWDPIFEPAADLQLPGTLHTYAEMDAAHKNTISHRYRSLNMLREYVVANATSIESKCSGASS